MCREIFRACSNVNHWAMSLPAKNQEFLRLCIFFIIFQSEAVNKGTLKKHEKFSLRDCPSVKAFWVS